MQLRAENPIFLDIFENMRNPDAGIDSCSITERVATRLGGYLVEGGRFPVVRYL